MSTELLPLTFHGDTLFLVEHNGEPYTPIRPIAAAMGLAWKAQTAKLKRRFDAVVSMIDTTGADGKVYKMLSLPLRKLPAFLYSIDPQKVKPAIRVKIKQYQAECDDVLWAYWFQGHASHPSQVEPAAPEPGSILLFSSEYEDLLNELRRLEEENRALKDKEENYALKDELLVLLRDKVTTLSPKPKRASTTSTTPTTEAEVAAIHAFRAQGLTHREISRRVGRSTTVVSYVLRAQQFVRQG